LKKIPALLSIFIIVRISAFAQVDSQFKKPTYQELKRAGQLSNYTPEQLTQMEIEEEKSFPEHGEVSQTRNEAPPAPTIQTTSSAFAITPVNPSVCTGQSLTLTASNSYTASTTGINIGDDRWSSVIALPFSFTFYGTAYNNLLISTNGTVTFNTTYANWWCSWWPWIISQPSTWPADETNTINGPWIDLYIYDGGTIKYSTVGTAPNRIFVVEYCNVAYWGGWWSPWNCSGVSFTGQTLLYEGTNIIETHIYNRPNTCLWVGAYYAIHSTQNSAGSTAAVVPGRNASNGGWSAFSEGKRWTWNNSSNNYDISNVSFAPVGISNATSINWYDSGNTLIGTGATYNVPSSLASGTYVYHAGISVSWCSGTINYTAYDTVTIASNLTAPTATSVTICPNTSASLSASCGGNCLWYTTSSGGIPFGTGYYSTPPLSSTTTYYVGYTSGSCASPRTPLTVTVGSTLAVPTATATSVCSNNALSTLTANCGSNCQWYSDTTSSAIGTGGTFTSIPPTTTYYVQTLSGGCTSSFATVSVPIGNLNVTASTSLGNCPTSAGTLTSAYSGAYSTNTTSTNSTASTPTAQQTTNNYCATSDPSDATNCPAAAYRTSTISAPAGVTTSITSTSIKGIYFWLADNGRNSPYDTLGVNIGGSNPKAVGADPRVWLKSPSGTYLLLADIRPLNSDYATTAGNYCYCPTFTPSGSDGVLGLNDGPFNSRNYSPDGGTLPGVFTGQTAVGTWTLYVSDVVGSPGGVHGPLPSSGIKIRTFKMEFETWPTVSYSWATTSSSGTCGTLSSTAAQSPAYTPPSPPASSNYSCTYTITVASGTCTGTQSVTVGCAVLPIELLSYTGTNTFRGNELKWVTATETNNSYFTLYRSRDAQTFDRQWKIQSKATNGNSTSNLSYAFLDGNVNPGVYYYRLTQTDIDGTIKEVGTIPLSVEAGRYTLNVIPNPTANKAEVTYECVADQKAQLKVYGHSGDLIMIREIACVEGENKYIIDLGDREDGIYLVTISTNDNVFKGRFIKAH
jgi:hypothetical protein